MAYCEAVELSRLNEYAGDLPKRAKARWQYLSARPVGMVVSVPPELPPDVEAIVSQWSFVPSADRGVRAFGLPSSWKGPNLSSEDAERYPLWARWMREAMPALASNG